MAIVYTNQHRTVPANYTRMGRPMHTGIFRWLGHDANHQKLYTSAQAVHQWWPAGMTTTAGTLGEQYAGQWSMKVPAPTTRLIVEFGGYAVASGGTTWRLYSSGVLYTGTSSAQTSSVAVTIVSTAHAFTTPAFVDLTAFTMPDDGMQFTWLRLTGENLNATASGRLWTMHVRPAPDTPP